MLLLGRSLLLILSIALLALILGLAGATIGDAKSARKRPLDAWEREIAHRTFGNSIDTTQIRLALDCRLMNWPKRKMARTPYNTIYLTKRYSHPEDYYECLNYEDFLAHEFTHCWQTQHGIPFKTKLRTALKVIFNRKKPYQYGLLRDAWRLRKQFRDFNTEQQATMMADYYCCKYHKGRSQTIGSCPCLEHFAQQVQGFNGYAVPDSIPEH
jgi:hypothetical protein